MPGQDRLCEIISLLNQYVRDVYGPGAYPTELCLRINLTKKKLRLPLVPLVSQDRPQDGRPARNGVVAGEGFRCLNWHGREFSFTKPQALVVAKLWEAQERGVPDVPDDTLLRISGSESTRLSDVFRGCDGWGVIVVEGNSRGTHRLLSLARPTGEGPESEDQEMDQ